MDQLQVSILDRDPTVAEAVALMLRAEGFVVRTWDSAPEFMAQPELPLAGCLIANLSMPDMAGLELLHQLTARQWPVPVIFLTSADDITTAVRVMKSGAINCLPTPVQRAELLEAVREACSQSGVVHMHRATQLRVRQMLEYLTPREREVLHLAVTGLVVKEMAARLGIAEKTIKTHKGNLMRKMQVRSTLALLRLMLTAGLLPQPWAAGRADRGWVHAVLWSPSSDVGFPACQ